MRSGGGSRGGPEDVITVLHDSVQEKQLPNTRLYKTAVLCIGTVSGVD